MILIATDHATLFEVPRERTWPLPRRPARRVAEIRIGRRRDRDHRRTDAWLVGGDRSAGRVGEGEVVRCAGRFDGVVVEELVVAWAEQDEVVELSQPATPDREDVMRFEFVRGGAAGVSAVPIALMQGALLRVGGAASDA